MYNMTSHGPVWSQIAGRELYNRSADLEESENIAKRSADLVVRLSERLRAGWRAITPPSRATPAGLSNTAA